MPRATTGYERLTQADRFSDDSDDDAISIGAGDAAAALAGAQPRAVHGLSSSAGDRRAAHPVNRHRRANSGVDLKAINARLERWADEIAAKFKRSQKQRGLGDEERLEIHYSVFHPPEGMRCLSAEALARTAAFGPDATGVPDSVITPGEFEAVVDSVRVAIREGTHPRMISQGSSGSYFARNPAGQVVGVFKPKDEEPYAAGNPKWNKWIHRNLFPCFFGRACLIPNLSYVSEAAAYVLDSQLRTYMVPYTDVVYLASKSFHYPFWDRYSHSRNRKPLPAKPGSFQVFLQGFKDANIFLREHPWPDQYLSGVRTNDRKRSGRRRRWADSCRPSIRSTRSTRRRSASASDGTGDDSGNYSDYDHDDGSNPDEDAEPELGPDNFMWTEELKQSFREELEKLVILDYIMRNTDRGLDNWMIKVDWSTHRVSIASEPMQLNTDMGEQAGTGTAGPSEAPRPVDLARRADHARATAPYQAHEPMLATATSKRRSAATTATTAPTITIGAIDNSLSWPWKHPDAWRSFPFGWLFLPVDLIGRPFSQKTRDHFLPLLTSPAWWSQTQAALRRVFEMDHDFQERMFAKQIAVMKGQAWNVVETLKTADHGPLELTRRAKVCVWDDLVEVPIAVPMRATSSEIRRRNDAARAEHEEMDIAAGAAGARKTGKPTTPGALSFDDIDEYDENEDLLIPSSSPLPNPGRFEMTFERTSDADARDAREARDARDTKTKTNDVDVGASMDGASGARPSAAPMHAHQHQRRYSYTTAASRRTSNSIAQQLSRERHGAYADAAREGGVHAHEHALAHHGRAASLDDYFGSMDDGAVEGDLGYAAAEGMENNRRRVIVERLEPVKTRNPVFTWC